MHEQEDIFRKIVMLTERNEILWKPNGRGRYLGAFHYKFLRGYEISFDKLHAFPIRICRNEADEDEFDPSFTLNVDAKRLTCEELNGLENAICERIKEAQAAKHFQFMYFLNDFCQLVNPDKKATEQ